MIRFIRLVIYHIYFYYLKEDFGNKRLAKFTVFLIFNLIIGFNIQNIFNLIIFKLNENYVDNTATSYISIAIIVGIPLGIYLYKESFKDF